MELLLAEQTLLVALDDDTGRDRTPWAGEAGLAAALLLDLGHRDLLRAGDDGALLPVAGEEPEHPLLREAHEVLLAAGEPRGARAWVDRLQRELKPLHTRLAQGLVERGLLTEERSKVFGLFPETRYPTADPGPEHDLRQGLIDVLVTGRGPSQQEALLVGLLEPLGLVDRVVPQDLPRGERRAARERAREIGQQGLAGTAVQQAVQEVQAAVISAVVITPAVTAAITSS